VRLASYILQGKSTEGPFPEMEEEMRKRLTAELLDAHPLVLFDNVPDNRTINSPSLALLLTGEEWRERRLGATETLTLPNRAVWFMTGNNPQLGADLVRRVVRIRLAPNEETPSQGRTFKHDDVEGWAREHRPQLVHAALVLVQAWIAAGMPSGPQKLESFNDWARVMGGILAVIGVPGFLGNTEETLVLNQGRSDVYRVLVDRWWALHREADVRATDLIQICTVHEELVSLLGKGSSPKAKESSIGHTLRKLRDRVFDGRRVVFVGVDGRTRSKLFALKPVGPRQPPAQYALTLQAEGAEDAGVDPF
jgi:putative DNA primase/helicase